MAHRKRSWIQPPQPPEASSVSDSGLTQPQFLQLNSPDDSMLSIS